MTPTPNFTSFASDDVLEAFMIENPNPTAEALELWMRRFPEHAADLLKFAPSLRLEAKRPTPRENDLTAIILALYQMTGGRPTADEWAECALSHPDFYVDILVHAETERLCGADKIAPGEVVELTAEQERAADRRADAILEGSKRLQRLRARVDPGVLRSPNLPR